MTQTKDQINSRALFLVQGLNHKERLVYEIGSETKFRPRRELSMWGNGIKQLEILITVANYYNSQGKHIATFRLKK